MATDTFIPEAWTWFSVTVTVIVARYVSRILLLKSFRKLTWEDFAMAIVTLLYIAEINLLIKAKFTPTNLISPDFPLDINDSAQVALRVWGSKLIVAHETNFTTLIWVTKASLLLYYAKLTLPGSYRWTKITAVYVGLSYVVMEILYFGYWCRPFYDYWAVPVPPTNEQCATEENHLILNFVFNVSSDFMIMAIPIPLLIRTRLPWRQKLALIIAFSLGLFVITSAALSRYHSFADLQDDGWVFWFAREASTAVIVANSPHLWALLRRVFNMESFVHHTPRSNQSASVQGRFFQDAPDPLSVRQSANKCSNGSSDRSMDTYDVEKVLADVERECETETHPPYMGTPQGDTNTQEDAKSYGGIPSRLAPAHVHKKLPSLPFEHNPSQALQTPPYQTRARSNEDEITPVRHSRSLSNFQPSLQ